MNRKYAIAIVVTILVTVFVGITSAATTSVSVNDTKGSPGSTVNVPINITGASNVGAIEIVLTYNSNVLNVAGVEKGTTTKNSLFDSNKDTPGIIAVGVADTGGINGDGSVANISFSVVGKLGDTSPLTLVRAELSDVDKHLDILATTANGMFTVAKSGGLALGYIGAIVAVAVIVVLILASVIVSRRRKPKVTA